MNVPENLNIRHVVKTPQGKGKIIAIQGDIAKVLVGGDILEMDYESLVHIKDTSKDLYTPEDNIKHVCCLNVDEFYINEFIENNGVQYKLLDADQLIDKFGDNENATWGKKTSPTLIRKAVPGEEIVTYVKTNEEGKYIKESSIIAKENQFVFQNVLDDKDVYIPQSEDIIQEYENYENIGNSFEPFIRKSEPSKLLYSVIKEPTVIIVASRGNFEQFLDAGATLKLEDKGEGEFEVTGINKGGFDCWSFTDKKGNIINESNVL